MRNLLPVLARSSSSPGNAVELESSPIVPPSGRTRFQSRKTFAETTAYDNEAKPSFKAALRFP